MHHCWLVGDSVLLLHLQFKSLTRGKKSGTADCLLQMLEKYSRDLEGLVLERTQELQLERQRTERLLAQMLPP